jgi:hypothetical protein
MTSVGLKGTPGWKIVAKAKLLKPAAGSGKLVGDTDSAAMLKLMNTYYEYGRGHWKWTQVSPSSSANSGLVKGGASAAACGGFSLNFKWLAENALGIDGIGKDQEFGQFITVPGVCIDHNWKGNVRTSKKDFGQLKCFKFHDHYWVTHRGTNYDVRFNRTFGGSAEIIWTKLDLADQNPFPKLAKGTLLKPEKNIPDGPYLMKLDKDLNGWPTWQIMTLDQVTALGR